MPGQATADVDRLVWIDADQAHSMRDLFASVFGHSMSPEHWSWKYANGQGRGVGLVRDGHMVAHYGGVSRRVAYFGEALNACQVCDVMVEPSANRALVRKGPLYQVAAAFLEAQVGHGLPHRVAFGFPSERHHALATRLGLYDRVDDFVRVVWPASASPARPHCRWSQIGRPGVGFDTAEQRLVDQLWRSMAPSFQDAIVGIRDAAWLQYRYLQHPQQHYQLLLVRSRWLRRALGVLVLRRHEDHLQLLDVVGPAESLATLVAVARHEAARAGLTKVEAWIARAHAHRLTGADDAEATITDLQITLPTIVHTPGPSTQSLRGRWFLMAGDADFT